MCLASYAYANGGFNFKQFDQLDQKSKYAVLDAALKIREASLTNFEFKTTCHKEKWGGQSFVPMQDEFEVIRVLNDRIYANHGTKQPDKTIGTWWEVGDKDKWTSYGEVVRDGRINSQSGQLFRGYSSYIANSYTDMLGTLSSGSMRLHSDGQHTHIIQFACVPMSEWLEAIWNDGAKGQYYKCSIVMHNDGQRQLIDVHIDNQPYFGVEDMMFDPNLGFAPCWFQYKRDVVPNKETFNINRTTISADSFQKIGDVYIPSQVSDYNFITSSSLKYAAASIHISWPTSKLERSPQTMSPIQRYRFPLERQLSIQSTRWHIKY